MNPIVKRQRVLFIGVVSLLLTLLIVTNTLGWQSSQQKALNTLTVNRDPQSVTLIKFARDKEDQETDHVLEGAVFALYQVTKDGDKQIGGYYTTNDKGQINVDVPPGEYYFEEITPPSGYTFDLDKNGKVTKHYLFTVSSEDKEAAIEVKVFNRLSKGQLEVVKTVKNEDDSLLSDQQKQQNFLFTITFSDKGTYSYQIDDSVNRYEVKSGNTITLKHGQQAIFKDIPEGIHYTVTEHPLLGVVSEASHSSGTIHSKASQAAFTNTFLTTTSELRLQKQVVSGSGKPLTEEQLQQEFTFRFTFSDKETAFPYETTTGRTGELKSDDTLTLKHDETVTFKNMSIRTTYTVTEEPTVGYISGQTYWEGQLVKTDGVLIVVTNEVDTDSTATNDLTFTKQVVAEKPDEDILFSFEVTFSDSKNYEYQIDDGLVLSHKSGDVIQLKANQKVTFKDLPVGVGYQIKELETPHYRGELTEVTGTILSSEDTNYTFMNHFEGNPFLQIKKVGEGNEFDPTKEFTFTVYVNDQALEEKVVLKAGEMSDAVPLTIGDTWRVVEDISEDPTYQQTGIVNSIGQITQVDQNVLVTQTNTHITQKQVTIAGQKHWIIPAEYQEKQPESIIVRLMNGDRLVATQEVKGPGWSYEFKVPEVDSEGNLIVYRIEEESIPGFAMSSIEDSYDITNTYVTPVQVAPLTVVKKITGDTPLSSSTFEFTLSPGDETVSIQGSGRVDIPSPTFDSPGTYHYTIREKNLGLVGYTYDIAVYQWTIVVEAEGDALTITSETLTKDGEAYNSRELVFVNQFKTSLDEKQTIRGTKTWHHGTNSTKSTPTSIIVLLLADNEVIQQKEIMEPTDWSYQFTVPVYTVSGEKIVYSIQEVPVSGYQTKVSGYDLINTYIESTPKPPGKKNPDKGILAQTGEKISMIAFIAGLILVIGVSGFYLHQRNHKKQKNKRVKNIRSKKRR